MPEIFKEAKLKIQRAEKHINDLNRMIDAFVAGRNHEVFIEHDSDGGDDLLKVKAISSLPDDFAMVLGDAVHNLHTALDFVINEIEFRTTGEMTDHTKFPIYPTWQTLVGAVNGGFKKKAPKEVIDCIVQVVQPYITGNGETLYGLHRMDIADKHQLLLTKAEFNFINGICYEDDAGIENALDTWLVIPGKVASMRLSGCRNAKITNQGNAAYRIMFDQPRPFTCSHPFAHQEVIWVLYCLWGLVGRTIGEIERAYALSQI
ncbi:hypothetical protein [Occallatibacter riparius]|uniref:Uncharacterized protein n=1 Tax=Occallatibacter riparius TaxID=1002689 RepID=A0A9J7BRP7_9BACT|nr:hypothetical protein [Occallatibacter riparius]UWZ85336.1 hypothetical protein MOP44_05205 [Occallatibacter riparius]